MEEKMNLYDLKCLVDRAVEQVERSSHGSPSEVMIKVKIFNSNAIGPSATAPIKSCGLGFDWDANRFILFPEYDLVKRDDNNKVAAQNGQK